jgi:hypothetical protein
MLHDGSNLGHQTCDFARSVAHRGQAPKTACASTMACGSTGFSGKAGVCRSARSRPGRRSRVRRADCEMGGRRVGTRCGRPAAVAACEQRTNCAVAERDSCCIAAHRTCYAIRLRRQRLHRFVGALQGRAAGIRNRSHEGLARRDLRRTNRPVRISRRPIERRGHVADSSLNQFDARLSRAQGRGALRRVPRRIESHWR